MSRRCQEYWISKSSWTRGVDDLKLKSSKSSWTLWSWRARAGCVTVGGYPSTPCSS
jgi:hypothetical protein